MYAFVVSEGASEIQSESIARHNRTRTVSSVRNFPVVDMRYPLFPVDDVGDFTSGE